MIYVAAGCFILRLPYITAHLLLTRANGLTGIQELNDCWDRLVTVQLICCKTALPKLYTNIFFLIFKATNFVFKVLKFYYRHSSQFHSLPDGIFNILANYDLKNCTYKIQEEDCGGQC